MEKFLALCHSHHVQKLYAFGSSTKEGFDVHSSDIDLYIELDIKDPVERGETLMTVWHRLEQLFQRKVDLLTDSSIQNPYLKREIENSKVLIYDREKQEIPI